MQDRSTAPRRRRNVPLPNGMTNSMSYRPVTAIRSRQLMVTVSVMPPDQSQSLAYCFLRVSRLGYGAFELLNRYELASCDRPRRSSSCCSQQPAAET